MSVKFSHAVGLSAYWQDRLVTVLSQSPKNLSGKEHGQLKNFKTCVGTDKAKKIIDYAVAHWQKFAEAAAANEGLKSFPSSPHIGFLLKYHSTAEKLQSAAEASVATPTKLPAGSPLTANDETELQKVDQSQEKPFTTTPELFAKLIATETDEEWEKVMEEIEAQKKLKQIV